MVIGDMPVPLPVPVPVPLPEPVREPGCPRGPYCIPLRTSIRPIDCLQRVQQNLFGSIGWFTRIGVAMMGGGGIHRSMDNIVSVSSRDFVASVTSSLLAASFQRSAHFPRC
jgi:hypothetical protein